MKKGVREGGREGGRDGVRDRGREGVREGVKDQGREGVREGGREKGIEGVREGVRDRGREGKWGWDGRKRREKSSTSDALFGHNMKVSNRDANMNKHVQMGRSLTTCVARYSPLRQGSLSHVLRSLVAWGRGKMSALNSSVV